jgi:hypothetical protein
MIKINHDFGSLECRPLTLHWIERSRAVKKNHKIRNGFWGVPKKTQHNKTFGGER